MPKWIACGDGFVEAVMEAVTQRADNEAKKENHRMVE
jgi:hypothetical protein